MTELRIHLDSSGNTPQATRQPLPSFTKSRILWVIVSSTIVFCSTFLLFFCDSSDAYVTMVDSDPQVTEPLSWSTIFSFQSTDWVISMLLSSSSQVVFLFFSSPICCWTKPATQAWALTRNQTGDIWLCRTRQEVKDTEPHQPGIKVDS